ncbi:MAG: hypothetical protein ACK6CT_06705 [Planctomycetia bacterium]|jgi:hypothetical protein
MSEPNDKKPTLVRFDFPPGTAADAIAAALNAAREKLRAEMAARQAEAKKEPEQ